ncbi:MAG: hypothetical protein WC107_03510 [Patescibacteria group bacterium]
MYTFDQMASRVGFVKALEIWQHRLPPDFIGQFTFERLLEVAKGGSSNLKLAVIKVLCTRATSFEQWLEVCATLQSHQTLKSTVLQKMTETAASFDHWHHIYAICPRGNQLEVKAVSEMCSTAITFQQWRTAYQAIPDSDIRGKSKVSERLVEVGQADDWIALIKDITSTNNLYDVGITSLAKMQLTEEQWLQICADFSLESGIGQLAIKKLSSMIS